MSRSATTISAGIAVVAATVLALSVSSSPTETPALGPTTTTRTGSTDGGARDGADAGPVAAAPDFDRSLLPDDLAAVTTDWATDFSRTTIDYGELLIGIRALPIRDRIPPIDTPSFVTVADADHIEDREPGLALEINGDGRFYPLSILTAHEIVNDVVGDRPVAVTFCPLCNSAIVFDRVVDGAELRFGVSGLLRNSDLIMWDNRTESLWQQLTGEGLVGRYAGEQLAFVPSSITGFGDFARLHPDGLVLGPDQGFGRRYGYNPYIGYSSRSTPYGFFDAADLDPRFPALERVVNVTVDGTSTAYPFSVIQPRGAINDEVNGEEIVVLWGGDTADALDNEQIARSRGIGTGIAFRRTVDGQALTLAAAGAGLFIDAETGSEWDLNGTAVTGPLAGAQLQPVVHGNEFWFAWAAFNPESDVFEG